MGVVVSAEGLVLVNGKVKLSKTSGRVSSNIGKALSNGFKKELSSKVSEAKKGLKKYIDKKIGGKKNDLMKHIGKIKSSTS